MTVVISIINLKGGVGKTTLAIALGEFLAIEHHLRVLVIDLDPQTNATVALIDEHRWRKRNIRGQTIMQLFNDHLQHTDVFSAEEAIIKGVSNINNGIEGLDLLPSSLDLSNLQDYLIQIPSKGVFSQRPLTILGEAIAETIINYDFILIDCPPNLGLITQNGLVMSQYYLIPVIPDILSTYGIPQIIQRIKLLEKETGLSIEPMGLVINKYREQGKSLHENRLRILQGGIEKGGYRRVFSTIIPESTRAATVMDFTAKFSSLHNKYTYTTPYPQYHSLTEEVLEYVRC